MVESKLGSSNSFKLNSSITNGKPMVIELYNTKNWMWNPQDLLCPTEDGEWGRGQRGVFLAAEEAAGQVQHVHRVPGQADGEAAAGG